MILAIDQGTSATKAILVDGRGVIAAHATAPVGQAHPRPGWVEQSADEIWASVQAAVVECLAGHDPALVAAVGLSTQRESLVLWERGTGRPLGPLLSWQDQRTVADCDRLLAAGHGDQVQSVSGLPLDPMFSALKASWLLDEYDADRSRSVRGELCLGTVDSWLLSRFSGAHMIEVGNAARTQLLDVRRRTWDAGLMELFGVPRAVLPRIVPSTGPFPEVRDLPPLPNRVPVAGVLGDSHAALFAHAGWRPAVVKATYGTGSSIMGLADPSTSPAGLCLTIAWDAGVPAYAVEGNVRASGASLAWLARLVGSTPVELAAIAAGASSDGVHLVPGFTGLGAPWWDANAVGLLTGLTLGTGVAEVARAALESIAFQVEDVVLAIERVAGQMDEILADGGPTDNAVLMQLQADTSGRRVKRALARNLSALGAAHLAGIGAGMWSWAELESLQRPWETYQPREPAPSRQRRLASWHRAVSRSCFRPSSDVNWQTAVP
jgi:glycerol kinase